MWHQLIQLSFKSQVGLQAQIREMLVGAILGGQIPVGVALPSTRVLAQQLGVARNTVLWALERLPADRFADVAAFAHDLPLMKELIVLTPLAGPQTVTAVPATMGTSVLPAA